MQDPLAAPPAASGGAVIQRRLLEFDPVTGEPVVVTVPLVTKTQLQDLYAAAVAMPYTPLDPLDPREQEFAGLSCAEVMVKKQILNAARTGEQVNVEGVMDRMMGRPKQSSESTKLVLTYEDTLKEIERKEQLKLGRPAPAAINTTVERPSSP